MNVPSIEEKTRYIQDKLQDAARRHNVRILLAIESGSRAWGFPSADSDYDVRMIYARNTQDYLAIEQKRDVIETDLVDDAFLGVPLDLNGWDLRKTLQLALKSNAVVVEWLVSPIVYMADSTAVAKLLQFASSIADLHAFQYHYDHLARHAWEDISQSSGPVKLKKYFYALRPALALTWIRRFGKAPPMNIAQMMAELELPENVASAIQRLIEGKAKATEADLIDRQTHIDEFLEKILTGKTLEKSGRAEIDQGKSDAANRLFLEIIR